MKIVLHFEIPYYQYLDEESHVLEFLPAFAKDVKQLLHLYYLMVLVRAFDQKAIALQRTGKLGTYPSSRGQEAAFVGIGHALAKDDIYVPYYRDVGALIQHGAKLSDILLFWGGDERGNARANSKQSFPYSVPVGSQPLYAAGAAAALKYQGKHNAVLAVCGDGATSQGDFYETMNVAGVWELPLVLVVCNNYWAISVPLKEQTAAMSIAQKAIAGGIHGEQVDGNDIIAVRDRVSLALEKARHEKKSSVIELLCYRHSDHTTADDATRYEEKEMRDAAWKKEPISRLRKYLENSHAWSADDEKNLLKQCQTEIDAAVEEYLAYPDPDPTSMFDYLYAKLPKAYADQREIVENMKGQGVDHG